MCWDPKCECGLIVWEIYVRIRTNKKREGKNTDVAERERWISCMMDPVVLRQRE